jgi:hypothetical protein
MRSRRWLFFLSSARLRLELSLLLLELLLLKLLLLKLLLLHLLLLELLLLQLLVVMHLALSTTTAPLTASALRHRLIAGLAFTLMFAAALSGSTLTR